MWAIKDEDEMLQDGADDDMMGDVELSGSLVRDLYVFAFYKTCLLLLCVVVSVFSAWCGYVFGLFQNLSFVTVCCGLSLHCLVWLGT